MPIELATPMPVQVPVAIPVIPRRTLVFVGRVLAVYIIAGLWIGLQCAYFGTLPGDARQEIAGP